MLLPLLTKPDFKLSIKLNNATCLSFKWDKIRECVQSWKEMALMAQLLKVFRECRWKTALPEAVLLIQPQKLWKQYVWKWVAVSKSSLRQSVLYHKQPAVPKLMRSLSWVCGPIDCHFSSFLGVSLLCHAEAVLIVSQCSWHGYWCRKAAS